MASLQDLDYMLTVLSARLYFSDYTFPGTEAEYKSIREHRGKESHSFYTVIEIENRPYRVSLNISRSLKVRASISPKTPLSAEQYEKFEAALPILQEALPDGITVSLRGNTPKFTQIIWDKQDACEEDELEPRIGLLSVTGVACMNYVLWKDNGSLTSKDLSAAISEAKKQFNKEKLKKDICKEDTIDTELTEDTLTLTIDKDVTDLTGYDDSDEDSDDEEETLDSFMRRFANSHRETGASDDQSETRESEYNRLRSSSFSLREREILSFFKAQMEKEKGEVKI